jgi:uncharacterized protein YprB with RNaseH-like and TPR domain
MYSGSRACWPCTSKARKEAALETNRFEPQSISELPVPPAGRPFADPRNNFTAPAYNVGVPRRDLLSSPIRVAVFDIEATSLNASFGRVLCAVARFFSPDEVKVWRADSYQSWKTGWRSNDEELVRDILEGLSEADIWVAHNGCRYDVPFMRTRALIHRMPAVHPKKIWDPCLQARKDFLFVSNRLDGINRDLQTRTQKTDVDPHVWASATMDHDVHGQQAMDYVVEHCKADVDSLCETAKLLAPYNRQIDSWGSFR